MMLKKRQKYLNTHACTANWCTDALRLVTLQPIFSCRALNSPRRDGEPLAQQNRKWRSETDRQNRTGYSLSPLPLKSLFFFLFFLRARDKEGKKNKTVLRMSPFLTNTEWHISEENPKSSIFLLPKYPSLLTFCTGCFWPRLIQLSLQTVFIVTLRLLKFKSSSFFATCQSRLQKTHSKSGTNS